MFLPLERFFWFFFCFFIAGKVDGVHAAWLSTEKKNHIKNHPDRRQVKTTEDLIKKKHITICTITDIESKNVDRVDGLFREKVTLSNTSDSSPAAPVCHVGLGLRN